MNEIIYKGRPLYIGDRIPGTALTLVNVILPRRGEFKCDCGKSVPIDISQLELPDGRRRKYCGHQCAARGTI